MRKHEQNESYPMSIGSSTLLVIFLILCMFTFAAISLTTAKNDYSNACNNAQRSRAYYNAANAAEEKLNELNQSEDPETDYSYEVKISDTQAIDVTLKWNTEKAQYDIVSWKTVNTAEWNGSDSIHVLQPNS